ncbi:hypothetical protein C5167_003827 [Papaver somniferum]|uniref:SWIM-type domain-containing protein n=1 Tax=Papaver somniferum TaxID=3469 RepID=A0A4Y7L1V5_PAPSO|nr:hypothetical protein C5167_003827 [Papaver somniferum]
MGSKDRNFWLTDIGGRFRDLHILGCKAGTSGDAFMAMVKTRLVNEQGMNSTLELFLFNDEEGNACDKCESEEMFISFWNKGKVNKDNLVRLWFTPIIPTPSVREWGYVYDASSVSGVSGVTNYISPVRKKTVSKRVEVRRSPRLNKTATVSGLKDMRPTRLDFEHEEQVELTQASVADNHVHESQSIPTQSSVAANHVQGYEDDQVNLPNVHQDECHPDDKPDFLFKDYDEEEDGEDESEDESGDDSEEETQEQMNYEDWVSMCARSAPVNASSDEDLPSQEVTQEEEAKWEEDFGQHLNEPQRLEMINEDTPEVTPGEISTGMAFGSMQAYKDHLREYAVLKHRDFKVKKGDKIRHYSYCAYRDAQKCAWMVNARKVPEKDDMTVTVRECNIEHTCKNPNEDYSRKCNAKFVAKYLLKTMDVASPVEKADDIAKKIIRPQLQTEIPKWVARHARMVIGLDGAHLTGKFGGVMLSATEMRKRIPDMAGLTFISDRMKGILESVKRLYPLSNHRYCLRHLYKNFLTKGFRNPRLVQLLWQAAKAYKYHHWEEAMQEIAEISPDAYKYLIDAEPKSWARSWFPHDVACEHIYSNFSESFNNMALKFRGKPLTQLVDMYTHLVMVLFSNRRKLAATWQAGDLVPAGKDLIKVMCDLRGNYECDPSVEHKVYEVTNKATGKVFVVKVEEKKCTCRQWQLRQFPCLHGVVALFKLNPNWSKYCSKYYTVDYYRTAYQWSITPLGDIDEYQNKTGINILHPHRLRDKGRPCVKRKKSWYEKNKQPKRVTKCSVCKGLDHNILTCQGPPVGSNPKKKGVRMECSVNGDEFCITAAPTKKMRKALSAPTTATTSASKTATADVPPFSKGKEAATTPSSSTAGSQKKCKATAPSSSAAVDVGSKRKVPSTSSTPSSACFNQIFNGTVNISSQTINITEPSSKRVRKPNSKYQQ